jgi:hypothetical protein
VDYGPHRSRTPELRTRTYYQSVICYSYSIVVLSSFRWDIIRSFISPTALTLIESGRK